MEIITHVRPHLDEVLAVWLIRNYWPGARDASVSFIDNNDRPAGVDGDPDVLYVGVGRGRFDEHRGVMGECAAGLVWAELQPRLSLPDEERRAVTRLVDWVREEDTGRTMREPHREFAVTSAIDGRYLEAGSDSGAAIELGGDIMSALHEAQKDYVKLDDDWAGRIELDSRFGRAVALTTDAPRADQYAYVRGFDLVLIVNQAGTYRTIRAAADTAADLSPVAAAIREKDPIPDWFLHHSGKLLILGGDHDAGAKPSALSLADMIELVR